MDTAKIRAAVTHYQEAFLKDLQKVMRIPSVKGTPEEAAPYGREPKRALEVALAIGQELGFKTGIVDDAVGFIQYGSDDKKYVGILGHLDVVAAGTGWSFPPFDLTEKDGILYGRGVLDNKGPIMSTLYALYILKELQIPLSHTIRIILGTDEESGMSDIPLYLAKEPAPIFGFTPDCKFPAVYGERGMVTYQFITKRNFPDKNETRINAIDGDFTRSSVPDFMTITLSDGNKIEGNGKRSPSNAPEMGINAITAFADTIQSLNIVADDQKYFNWIAESFHNKHDGSGLDIAFEDEDSGKLQLTPYLLDITDDAFRLEVSIRYPISVSENQITSIISENLPEDTSLQIIRRFPSKLFPKDHPMIQQMQNVYERVTGLDGTPVTTTGATYARTMPNTIAFGPSFPGQKGIAHNADEYMVLSDLMLNMEIYALTIYMLGNI